MSGAAEYKQSKVRDGESGSLPPEMTGAGSGDEATTGDINGTQSGRGEFVGHGLQSGGGECRAAVHVEVTQTRKRRHEGRQAVIGERW